MLECFSEELSLLNMSIIFQTLFCLLNVILEVWKPSLWNHNWSRQNNKRQNYKNIFKSHFPDCNTNSANLLYLDIAVYTFEQDAAIRKDWRARYHKAINRFDKTHFSELREKIKERSVLAATSSTCPTTYSRITTKDSKWMGENII